MKNSISIVLLSLLMFVSLSCKRSDDEKGKITIKFNFVVDGQPLQRDTLMYVNAAQNQYMVTDLQMLVSKLYLVRSDGEKFTFNTSDYAHYIDITDNSTLTWEIDGLPSGVYNTIGFTFGLDSAMNVTGLFKNPPISDMFWPESLGGGYHYMKLNCKWKSVTSNNVLLPLNFHLGIGQVYNRSTAMDTLFVDNSFPMTFDVNYEISSDFDNVFEVSVNINNWFTSPFTFNFDDYIGVAIMQSQNVQTIAKANGHDVFLLQKNNKR